MSRWIACGSAVLLLSSSALAADIEAPAPYDWSGLYVGLHAGYLWGDVEIEEDGETEAAGDIDGFAGGALAGFNIQLDPLVLGLEGDIGWTDVDGNGPAAPDPDYSYELNWNAHVRARVGLAFERSLIFAAGGLAIADLDLEQEVTVVGGSYYGWSIGGGIDHAFTDSLIGRIEYLHDEYGDKDYEEELEDYSADLDTDTVRAALIYKFKP